jgi:hypothetical protein
MENISELAKQALKHVNAALELCENDSAVFRALEDCRMALEDEADAE